MERENIIETKSFTFALSIIDLVQEIQHERREYVLCKQLLRSGTAIGALVCEAQYAESKKDFIHKLSIALKEANETKYWIRLLYRADYIKQFTYLKANNDLLGIIKLLTSIINSSKRSLKFN